MTVSLSISRQLQVATEEGLDVVYTLRGLMESEIDDWASFCASVFAYKSPPPPASYFGRHYYNDPSRKASYVRVALCGNEMAASCRVFIRSISDGNGRLIHAGGIGEVCTSLAHRRRGLSKELLLDCIEIMTQAGMKVSMLHCAPDFVPFYQSVGYSSTTTRWSVAAVSTRQLLEAAASALEDSEVIRFARFPNDTERLMCLHEEYSEQRFAGCVVRSSDYWDQYLPKELEGSLWVLECESTINAWISIRERNGRIQVREFGCDDKDSLPYRALAILLKQATEQLVTGDSFELLIPSVVLDDVRQCVSRDPEQRCFIDWDQVVAEDDQGWMYRPLCDHTFVLQEMDAPHLIWPADSF